MGFLRFRIGVVRTGQENTNPAVLAVATSFARLSFPRDRFEVHGPGAGVAAPHRGTSERGSSRALLRQPHLHGDPFRLDGAGSEGALGGEALELCPREGAVSEPRKYPLRDEGIQLTKLHPRDFLGDVDTGRLPAHVLDDRRPTAAQDTVHLI